MKFGIYLLLAVLTQSPAVVDSQDLPWYMKLLQVFLTSPTKEALQQNLIKFIDSEEIDGVPFNPSLVKAFVLTTDWKMLLEQGVDINKLSTDLFTANDKVNVVVSSIKFDVLQKSWNLTAFFNIPNVTDVIRAAGIPPDMLQVVLMNIDFKGVVEAIPVAKMIELYSPGNNATAIEKANMLVKFIDTRKLINSIYWKRLQSDENFIKMLDNDFTGSTADPALIKALVLSIDLHELMTKGFDFDVFSQAIASDSQITEAVIESIDFNRGFRTFNVTIFLQQPNITKTLKKNNINPNMVRVLLHANMTKLAKSANLGGVIKAYSSGDNNTRPARISEAVDKIDNQGILQSVNWKDLKSDPSFQALLIDFKVPNKYIKVIKESGFEGMASGIDYKGIAKEMLINQETGFDFTKIVTNYIDIQKVAKAMDLGLLIQTFLNANTSLKLSKNCQKSFFGIAFPLPSFNNMEGFQALEIAKHPMIQLLDSWSKIPPGIFQGHNNWLGAADQCQKVVDAKYCIANMDLSKMSSMLQGGTFGFCLPKSCTEKDGQNLLEFFFKEYLTDEIKFEYRPWAANRPLPVNCQKEKITYTQGFKAAMAVTGIMLALGLIGSIVDEITVLSKKSMSENEDHETEKKKTKEPLYVKILACFSIPRNIKAVMSTYMPKGAVGSINGIKVISLWWVVVGHAYANLNGTNMDNKIAVKNFIHRYASLVIMNAYPCVDTFFLIGGLLVSYLSLKRMDKTGGRLDLLMFFLHRFLRVTPMFMFILLFKYNVIPHYYQYDPMGIFDNPIGGQEICQKYWWTNLLYIHNFYPKSFWRSCHPVSWYLANDMQFYVVSPVFLYLIYHLEKKLTKSKWRNWSGPIVLMSGVFMCFCVNVALIDYNNYPAIHAAYQLRWLLKPNPRADVRLDPQDETYDKPYTRVNSYLIGMLVGYMFSRKLEIKHKYKKGINVFFWIAASITGYLCVYGPSQMYKEKPVFLTDSENLAFGSLHIIGWSFAVGWVIYACHYGMGGVINDFLSWKAWIPLSRLSLGVYLLHSDVIGYFLNRYQNGYHYTDAIFTYDFTSILIVSFFISFMVSILVELPLFNLEKVFLR